MELREALTQVGEIRAHMARAETFQGYRSASVGFSGLVATFGVGQFLAAGVLHFSRERDRDR